MDEKPKGQAQAAQEGSAARAEAPVPHAATPKAASEPHPPAATARAKAPGGRDAQPEARAQRPRRKRKWPIVVGVVAVVMVAAGVGFWTWHEQPSFCNAICHEPMDNYVEGYFNDATLMANTHKKAQVTCLECHEAKLSEQVAEGMSWGDPCLRRGCLRRPCHGGRDGRPGVLREKRLPRMERRRERHAGIGAARRA